MTNGKKIDPVQRKKLEAEGYHAPSKCPNRGQLDDGTDSNSPCDKCLIQMEVDLPPGEKEELTDQELSDRLGEKILEVLRNEDPTERMGSMITVIPQSHLDKHAPIHEGFTAIMSLSNVDRANIIRYQLSQLEIAAEFFEELFTGKDPMFTLKALSLFVDCSSDHFLEMIKANSEEHDVKELIRVGEVLHNYFSKEKKEYALLHIEAVRGLFAHASTMGATPDDMKKIGLVLEELDDTIETLQKKGKPSDDKMYQ